MLTFVVVKGRKEFCQVVGTKEEELERKINMLIPSS